MFHHGAHARFAGAQLNGTFGDSLLQILVELANLVLSGFARSDICNCADVVIDRLRAWHIYGHAAGEAPEGRSVFALVENLLAAERAGALEFGEQFSAVAGIRI